MTNVVGRWFFHGAETTRGLHLLVFGKTGEESGGLLAEGKKHDCKGNFSL
jgi:hypothetical protein